MNIKNKVVLALGLTLSVFFAARGVFISAPAVVRYVIEHPGPVEILGLSAVLVLTFFIFFGTYKYMKFNLRRLKVAGRTPDGTIAVSPVMASAIRRVYPESRFRSPVLIFGARETRIVETGNSTQTEIVVPNSSMSDVTISSKSVLNDCAGYVSFTLEGRRFKVFAWSPPSNTKVAPMLPTSQRQHLLDALTGVPAQ